MLIHPNFKDGVKVQRLNAPETALADALFPASAAFLDVADFDLVVFMVNLGGLDSALTFQVQQAAAANGTPKDVTGAVKVVGTTDDNQLFTIEVETRRLDINNGYHYVTLALTGAAGSNDYASIVALLCNPGYAPVTQPSTTYANVVVAG